MSCGHLREGEQPLRGVAHPPVALWRSRAADAKGTKTFGFHPFRRACRRSRKEIKGLFPQFSMVVLLLESKYSLAYWASASFYPPLAALRLRPLDNPRGRGGAPPVGADSIRPLTIPR